MSGGVLGKCKKCGDVLPDSTGVCVRCRRRSERLLIWGGVLLAVTMFGSVAFNALDLSTNWYGPLALTDVAAFVLLIWGWLTWPKSKRIGGSGPLKYCLNCGSVGPSKEYTPGDFLIMVVLLLLFVLPGLIYWAWRLTGRYWGCAKCRSKRIIPADAPAAQAALKKVEPSISVATRAKRFCTACGTQIYPGNRHCAGCGQAVEDVA
jgi:hypothetical protein